ncbi:hypothetical protein VPH35_086270 [Triticum aestivum]
MHAADKFGLATSPPYLALSSTIAGRFKNYVNGDNFASDGAGVSIATNENKRVLLSLSRSLGQAQAASHLARSIFAITIGSNDIIHYAKANPVATSSQQQRYVNALLQTLSDQLAILYNHGARKYPDLHYALFNSSAALLRYIDQPAEYGFTEAKAACCSLGDFNTKSACTPLSSYCANRSDHMFWDFYHPTEATTQMLTATAFDGSAPFIFPTNVRQLSAI